MDAGNATNELRISKFALWYTGIFIEIIAPFVSMSFVTTFQSSKLTERFSTLTFLVLGEGVIGYAVALQKSISPAL